MGKETVKQLGGHIGRVSQLFGKQTVELELTPAPVPLERRGLNFG